MMRYSHCNNVHENRLGRILSWIVLNVESHFWMQFTIDAISY